MRWCGRDLRRLVIIECVPAGGPVDLKGTETAGTPVIAISCRGCFTPAPLSGSRRSVQARGRDEPGGVAFVTARSWDLAQAARSPGCAACPPGPPIIGPPEVTEPDPAAAAPATSEPAATSERATSSERAATSASNKPDAGATSEPAATSASNGEPADVAATNPGVAAAAMAAAAATAMAAAAAATASAG
jgi:hypothetical protein